MFGKVGRDAAMTPTRQARERTGRGGAVIQLRTFGEATIEAGGRRIGPGWERGFALALYLAVERDRRTARATLQALLFPGSTDRNASHSLRQLIYRLRQLHVPIEADGDGVGLPIGMVIDDYSVLLQTRRFAPDQLESIGRGFLPGFAPSFAKPFSDWCDYFRSRTTIQIQRTIVDQLAELRRRGAWVDVERAARACLSLDPLNEEGTFALAESLAMTGSKLQALDLLDTYLSESDRFNTPVKLPAQVLRRRIADRFAIVDVASPSESPLVGREELVGQLQDTLAHALSGSPDLITITGSAGVGKSRLGIETLRFAALRGAAIERVAFELGDERRPLSTFSRLVPRLLSLPGGLGCSPTTIAALELLNSFPRLAEFQGPSLEESEARFSSLRVAIQDLFDAILGESCLVILVEDCHLGDHESLQLLSDLVQTTKSQRLLVVLTTQSIMQASPAIDSQFRVIRLEPLDRDSAARLLRTLLGDSEELNDLRSWMLQVAGGNPLFLESLVSHYRTSAKPYSIPNSLAEVLKARISSLDEVSRKVLELCAVLGSGCTSKRLERGLGLDRLPLLLSLQRLEDDGLITCEGRFIAPAHELLRQAILESTAPSVKRMLHGISGTLLEQEDALDAEEHWARAGHWNEARDEKRTVGALKSLAQHAIGIGCAQEACDLLESALTLCSSAAERESVLRDLSIAAANAADWQLTVRALEGLKSLGVKFETWMTIAELEALYKSGADPEHIQQALLLLIREGETKNGEKLRAAALLLSVADQTCDASAAAVGLDLAEQASECSGELSSFSRRTTEMIYHTTFGDLARAAETARELLDDVRYSRSDSLHCRALNNASLALYRAGFVEESTNLLRRSLARAKGAGLQNLQLWIVSQLAWHSLNAGEWESAERWSDAGERIRTESRRTITIAKHFANLTELALRQQSYTAARRWLDLALESVPAARHGKTRLLFGALGLEIAVAERRDLPSADVRSLLNLYETAKGRGLEDSVVLGLAKALRQLEQEKDAIGLLHAYTTRFRRVKYPLAKSLEEYLETLSGGNSAAFHEGVCAEAAGREKELSLP